MGLGISREEYLEQEKRSLEDRISLRFPGFKETDEKFLKMQAETNKLFSKIPDFAKRLASFTGLPQAIGPILTVINSAFLDSSSSIESAMLALKIEKAVVNTVHTLIEAEMKSIARQLRLINDEELSREEKKTHLAIADHSCYQLLAKFNDSNFYLKKYPLVFAPFLMSFVSVYVPIAIANYQVVGTNRMREDCKANMQQLKDIVIYFKEQSVKKRLQYIDSIHPVDEYPFISDSFLEKGAVLHILLYTKPNIFREIYRWYCNEMTSKYQEYFQPGLRALQELDF